MIPDLKTKRLHAEMRELTIGECLHLSKIRGHEEATGYMLRHSVTRIVSGPPLHLWAAQERTYAVGHYLAAHLPDGPNFSVGAGRFSDYLRLTYQDAPANILTGHSLEAIERTLGSIDVPPRAHWIIGIASEIESPAESDEELVSKMQAILARAGHRIDELLSTVETALPVWLVELSISNDGLVALSAGEEGQPQAARFPAHAALPARISSLA